MRTGDIELRHIVDVDGQLIGFDADVVNASTLLRRAGREADRRVFMVQAGASVRRSTRTSDSG